MALPGWGTVAGRIAEWFPGRKEKMVNRIEAIKKEMYEIQNKPVSARSTDKYTKLSEELADLEKRLQTIS